MKPYIVRLNGDQIHPRELVGIFIAEDEVALYRLIDESVAPESCEFKELEKGGIYWSESLDFVVPYKTEDIESENVPPLPGGATLTESWVDAFVFDRDAGWTPFAPDDLGGALI